MVSNSEQDSATKPAVMTYILMRPMSNAWYLGKAVSGGHHLEAAQHSCSCWCLLSIPLAEAVEGLPRQAGFSPGVPCGRGGVLLPVARPEHTLCHIAAQTSSEHSVSCAAAMHSAVMHYPGCLEAILLRWEQIVESPPLPGGGAAVGLGEAGLPFWVLSWTSPVC